MTKGKGRSTEDVAPALTLTYCVLSSKVFPFSRPPFHAITQQVLLKHLLLNVPGARGAGNMYKTLLIPAFVCSVVRPQAVDSFSCCITN